MFTCNKKINAQYVTLTTLVPSSGKRANHQSLWITFEIALIDTLIFTIHIHRTCSRMTEIIDCKPCKYHQRMRRFSSNRRFCDWLLLPVGRSEICARLLWSADFKMAPLTSTTRDVFSEAVRAVLETWPVLQVSEWIVILCNYKWIFPQLFSYS